MQRLLDWAPMQMVGSTVVPLGPNTSKENIPIPPEAEQGSIQNTFNRGFPFPEPSSISKILADIENFNINNENKRPYASHAGPVNNHNNPNKYFERSNEVASLKAELEVTRRKLAGYETWPNDGLHTHGSFEHDSQSPNIPNNTFDFAHKDLLTWSDFNSSFPEAPPQPQPPPSDFPIPVPPLRLPPATVPLHTANLGTNVHSSMLYLSY
jgi:hypothetical protein